MKSKSHRQLGSMRDVIPAKRDKNVLSENIKADVSSPKQDVADETDHDLMTQKDLDKIQAEAVSAYKKYKNRKSPEIKEALEMKLYEYQVAYGKMYGYEPPGALLSALVIASARKG
jgi:hypothetical protein